MAGKTQSTITSPYNLLKKGYSKVNHYYVDDKGCTVYYYNKAAKGEEDDDKPKTRKVMSGWITVKEILHNNRLDKYTYILIGKDVFGKEFKISMPSDIMFGQHQKLFAEIAPHFSLKTDYKFRKYDGLQSIICDVTAEGYTTEIKELDQITWAGNRLIIPGMEPDGFRCTIDQTIFPYSMPKGLNVKKGLKALDYIIKSCPFEKIMPLIILAFTSPVIGKLFPDDRYGYTIVGETGTLKTAITRLILQIYGSGFSAKTSMVKLGDDGITPNAAKNIAGIAGCMPLLLDNFKPFDKYSKSDLASLIHSLMEGSDKRRLSKDSELKNSRSFLTMPIITGEDYKVDASTSARVMPIYWKKPDTDILDLATPELRQQLPALGRVWLKWLNSEDGLKAMDRMKKAFPEERRIMIEAFKGVTESNPSRLATNMALHSLGFRLMAEHPVFGEYFKNFSPDVQNSIVGNIESIGRATSEGTEANALVEMLREGIASGTLGFERGFDRPNYGQTVIGWNDDNYVYIYPKIMEEYAAKHLESTQKLSASAIGRQLVSHKLIEPHIDAKTNKTTATTPKYRAATQSTARVYAFKKETLIDTSMAPKVVPSSEETSLDDVFGRARAAG